MDTPLWGGVEVFRLRARMFSRLRSRVRVRSNLGHSFMSFFHDIQSQCCSTLTLSQTMLDI